MDKIDKQQVKVDAAKANATPANSKIPRATGEYLHWIVKDIKLENGDIVTRPALDHNNGNPQLVDSNQRTNISFEVDIFATDNGVRLGDLKLNDPQVNAMDMGSGTKQYYGSHNLPSPTFAKIWTSGVNRPENLLPGQVNSIKLAKGIQKVTLSTPVTHSLIKVLLAFANIDGKVADAAYTEMTGLRPGQSSETPSYLG